MNWNKKNGNCAWMRESMAGMKIAYLALPLALGLFPAQSQQVPPKPTSTTGGRYQMISAQVENGNTTEPTAFLLDTDTGKVWKYQGPFQYKTPDGKMSGEPGVFIPIEVRQPKINP
jgi:hypothetical protein